MLLSSSFPSAPTSSLVPLFEILLVQISKGSLRWSKHFVLH